jgi:phosphoribosyl-ATP pyrophosphohydrolase/phosphoribosyl-AMP cyclohydrolase
VAGTEIDLDALWSAVTRDEHGLAPCVVQDLRTRAVLMVAWVSREALENSIATGWATYYSRSRKTLWVKGEVSGNRQRLIHVRLDCDGDTLLYLVEAKLPACHEGTDTCFSRRQARGRWKREPIALAERSDRSDRADVIESLETIIAARAASDAEPKPSYTRRLLEGGVERQVEKIREESEELAKALETETNERVVAESADVLYHLAVALKARELSFAHVFAELERRLGRSGIEEKEARAELEGDL